MSKKSKIINISIIILSIIILFCYVFLADGFQNLISVFSKCNPLWLLGGVGLMILYWYLEGHSLNICVGFYGKRMNARQSAKNTMIGQFFNNITPSVTGGQPLQAYYMKRCGYSVGLATSSLLIKFITYQITLTLFSAIVLIFKYNYFAERVNQFALVITIGFIIDLTVAALLFLIGFKKKVATIIIHAIIGALAKIRIIKNKEQKLIKIDKEVELFNNGFKAIKTHKKELLFILMLTAFQLLAFYSVNIMIAFSFGMSLTLEQAVTLIAGASCIQMSSFFVPLPGAAGGAELSYHIIYSSILGDNLINAAMLTWRILTFYMPIIVGMFFARDVFGQKDISNEVKKS